MCSVVNKLLSFFISIAVFFISLFGNTASIKDNYKYIKDIPYGKEQEQKVDICIPKNTSGTLGVMVYIHSGGWSGGYRREFREQMIYNAQKLGIASISVGYRFASDSVNVFDMLDDITNAISTAETAAWLNSVRFGNMALTGLSAGAHLALMYAYKNADDSPLPVKFVVSQAGPADFTDKAYYTTDESGVLSCALPIDKLCGTNFLTDSDYADKLKAASPVSYVNDDSVITVIAHSCDDSVIPYSNAETLNDALAYHGVGHYMFVYDGVDHFISDTLSSDKEYIDTVEGLINEYLK